MLQGEMRFVGVIGIDGGGNDLNSRYTHPMSFTEAAEWFTASRNYFAMMVKHDCNIHEISVSVYNADEISSITVEPIVVNRFRP